MSKWLRPLWYKALAFRAKVRFDLWMMQCKMCEDCVEVVIRGDECSCGKVKNQ